MKKIILLLTAFISVNAFALPQQDLDHMDLVDLTQSNDYRLEFTVQYPGLGEGGFKEPDCLALIVGKKYVQKEELLKFAKLVSLADGDGVLFPGNSHRSINGLKPEIIKKRRPVLVFKLRDLGTYVTGLRITNFTVYAGFRHAVQSAFGETTGTTAFQFLRGCKL